MSSTDRVLGLPELDAELNPALPAGWLGLILGASGSGTHLLAKQFAHVGVGELPVLYYTTYERSEDVAKAFTDFGWDSDGVKIVNLAQEYYDRVLLRDLEVSRAREKGLKLADFAEGASLGAGPRTFNLTSRLLADVAGMDSRFRLVIDSLDFLLEILEPAEVLNLARQVRHSAQRVGGEALLVIQADVHEKRTSGLLEDMADVVFELVARPNRGRYDHGILIRKVRNHPERSREWAVSVGDRGFSLLPEASS